MKALLIYPLFPKSFWSFEKALKLVGKKSFLPPLGLITVAAILPSEWSFKLVDINVRDITQDEWNWADMVLISGMIVQEENILHQIKESKKYGKCVVVGGPYPTTFPQECQDAGADFLVLDEGEITIPLFVEALKNGQSSGIFRANGQHPDMAQSPIPRFDLLNLSDYGSMSVQFSRGCPYNCEFCDIVELNGKRPRTKPPQQMIADLQVLYDLGWRDAVFVVDDNFVANKRNVKLFLNELEPWLNKTRYPFTFNTQASLDLAEDQELLDMMVICNFGSVFLGIETPDEESLLIAGKGHNIKKPLQESVYKIQRSGIRIMAGFIIGFDNEKQGAGKRITEFVQQADIPIVFYSMLHAIPNTALWRRLQKEDRLIDNSGNILQTTLPNFVPTRPTSEIAKEFVDSYWEIYDPLAFLERTYKCYCILGEVDFPPKNRTPKKLQWNHLSGLSKLLWFQGIVRNSRWKFWSYLFRIYQHNPGGFISFLNVCASFEHFYEFRQVVKEQVSKALMERGL